VARTVFGGGVDRGHGRRGGADGAVGGDPDLLVVGADRDVERVEPDRTFAVTALLAVSMTATVLLAGVPAPWTPTYAWRRRGDGHGRGIGPDRDGVIIVPAARSTP